MNFKISVILLHLFTTTLPISQHSLNSISVLASNIDTNDTQSEIRELSAKVMTSILSETCSGQYCYSKMNETARVIDQHASKSTSSHRQHFDRLASTSILYGILKTAAEQRSHQQNSKCHNELNQIYEGIHRKKIWAIKGLYDVIKKNSVDRFFENLRLRMY